MPKTDPTSEKFQIAIFTCAFLAAGLALITLVLALFMNPSSASEVKGAEEGYQKLTKLLASPEMKSLRAQAKVSEGQDINKLTLPEIVSDSMKVYGLDFSRFERASPKAMSGLEEIRQPIDVKPAKLVQILQFIARVKEAKKSIQVRTVKIERDRKAKGEGDDSWTANVEFVDYVSK